MIAACCRHYVQHCGGAADGWASDPTGHGEERLLRELAPVIEVALDVGAHSGAWTASLLAQNPRATIHAFEPASDAYRALELKQFPDQVHTYRTAMSSSSGRAHLHLFDGAAELNSLHNRFGLEEGFGIKPAILTEEVEVSTVDAFCTSQGLTRIDLLKIDTEGHEVDVLRGSIRSLEQGVIGRVQFEYGGTYIDSRRLLKDAFEVFAGLDYALFRIVPGGLLAFPRYDQRLEDFRFSNYLALRKDLISRTRSARHAMGVLR